MIFNTLLNSTLVSVQTPETSAMQILAVEFALKAGFAYNQYKWSLLSWKIVIKNKKISIT